MENLETQTTITPENPPVDPVPPVEPPAEPPKTDNAEISKLRAAIDKLTKENAEQKRVIRAKQTEEERKAEEEAERQAAIEAELTELRKKSAVSEISKRVLGFVGDEAVSNTVAESLFGAADIDAALDAIQRAWVAREKKLRMEFGKIPAPGAGSDEPTITKEQLAGMSYSERVKLANEHPDLYNKLNS